MCRNKMCFFDSARYELQRLAQGVLLVCANILMIRVIGF